MSIHKSDLLVKLFSRHKTIIFVYLVAVGLVGIACFMIGSITTFLPQKEPITIEYPPAIEPLAQTTTCDMESSLEKEAAENHQPFVASKNGTKYYKVTCSGVARINEENKVYFATEIEAQNAGYDRASGCFD